MFENNQNHDWYVDDASIQGSSSGDRLTNGNVEASSSLTSWSAGSNSSCTSYGISTSRYYAGSRAYVYQCADNIAWLYLDHTGSISGSETNRMYVYIIE